MKRILLATSLLFPLAALAQDYPSPTLRAASVLGTLTTNVLNSTGAASISGTLTAVNNASIGGILAVTGNTTVGGTLGVTGNTTFGGIVTANGAASALTMGNSTATTNPFITLNGASGARGIRWQTAASARWGIGLITSEVAVTTINTNNTTALGGRVLNFASTTGVVDGYLVTGTNIPTATIVVSHTSTTVTISKAVTGSGISSAQTITFDPMTGADLALQRFNTSGASVDFPVTFSRAGGMSLANSAYGVTGTISAAGTQGRTNATALYSNVNLNGTYTADAFINLIAAADTAVQSNTATQRQLLGIQYTAGVGSVGANWALDVRGQTAGTTGDFAAGVNYNGGAARMNGNLVGNQGGTAIDNYIAGANTTSGEIWGANITAQAQSAATFVAAIRGVEINVALAADSSAAIKYGLKITAQGQFDRKDAAFTSAHIALGVGGTSASKFRSGIKFGGFSDLVWPWDTGSVILDGSQWGLNTDTLPQSAGAGLDLYAVEFANYSLRMPGTTGPWFVEPSGATQIGTTRLVPSSSGMSITAAGSYATAIAVSAGGSGYAVGNLLYFGTGGVARVATLSGSAVATVTLVRAPYLTDTSTPANPVATTVDWRSAGSAATLNVTWNTTANLLALNPAGNTRIGTGSAIATNATSGFLMLPTMAGAPTGTVGSAGNAAVVVDTTNKKLCYSVGGGTWECSAAFTP